MKYDVLKQIKLYFPEYYKAKTYDYQPRLLELEKLYLIIDLLVYSGKLEQHRLKISIVEFDGKNSKGRFSLGKDGDDFDVMATIVKHPTGDNFALIVSVLCHELIHMYDFYYGKLKAVAIHDITGKPFLDVKDVGNRQFVKNYDVHGNFFYKEINKIALHGIIVKETYSHIERNLMKKIRESKKTKKSKGVYDEFFGREMVESLNETDLAEKLRIIQMYDCLKNCEKSLKFYDKDHWYISIS